MYKARRTDAYFRGEVDKFIQAVENHARIEKTQIHIAHTEPTKI